MVGERQRVHRWRRRHAVGFVTVAVGIVAVAAIYFQSYASQFRVEAEQRLTAIATLKTTGLVQWRRERLADGDVLAGAADFSVLAQRWRETPADPVVQDEMGRWMRKILAHEQYDQVRWLDQGGTVRLEVTARGTVKSGIRPDAMESIPDPARVSLSDFYRDEEDGRVHLALWIPITGREAGGPALGGLLVRIAPTVYLYPYIGRWPAPSATAETLLVRRDGDRVLFLSELRFRKGSAFAMHAPLTATQLPAVQAVLGRTGIVEGVDYRGVPVMAEVRSVPGSPWFLVTRMDAAEVFALLRERLWGTVLFAGLLVLVVGAGMGLIWRWQREGFYRARYETLKALRESENFLVESQSIAGIGSYAYDVTAARWKSSAVLDEIFGINADYPHTTDGWIALIHPDWRSGMADYLTNDVIGRRQPFDREYLIVRPRDGAVRWVHGLGHLEFDQAQRPERLIGTIQDVTRRKQIDVALQESEAKFRTLFEAMTEGVALHEVVYAPDGTATDYRIVAVNPAFERHTGIEAARARGQLGSALYMASPPPYLENYEQVARTGEPRAFETFFPGLQKYFHIGVISPKRGSFATIFEDVTQRRRQQEELREKNAELERFTYTVSHDLKSPLITIKGFTGALLSDVSAGRTDRLENDLRRVSAAADKMSLLLNDLLELSRIGRAMRPPEPVVLTTLVQEVLAQLAGPIAQAGAQVIVAAELPVVAGDRQRLGEVWQNLIENALKFRRPGTQPVIEIGVRNPGAVLLVRDDGLGIEPRYHETVFGLFNQLDARAEGSGIGLALVRRIVEVHGGRIWVESAGAGQGATFCFTLPANPAVPFTA